MIRPTLYVHSGSQIKNIFAYLLTNNLIYNIDMALQWSSINSTMINSRYILSDKMAAALLGACMINVLNILEVQKYYIYLNLFSIFHPYNWWPWVGQHALQHKIFLSFHRSSFWKFLSKEILSTLSCNKNYNPDPFHSSRERYMQV